MTVTLISQVILGCIGQIALAEFCLYWQSLAGIGRVGLYLLHLSKSMTGMIWTAFAI